ncbi:MAG TPA: hypothetical protein VKQ70_02205, partial [Caulobacteraceae bacterium]|nr:hypothetical protein [Caulobacteraceae bacterium]
EMRERSGRLVELSAAIADMRQAARALDHGVAHPQHFIEHAPAIPSVGKSEAAQLRTDCK